MRSKGNTMTNRTERSTKNDGPIWWLVDHGGAPRWLIVVGAVLVVGGGLAYVFEPTGWMPL
jgi:hypothetical protein